MVAERPIATLIAALAITTGTAFGEVVLTEGTNLSIDVAPDGRIALDLLGSLWVLPHAGGVAEALTAGILPAERPRWSPDGGTLVFQVQDADRRRLALYSFADNRSRTLSTGRYFDRDPDFHPDGDRIVFSSDRRDSGFDLWELDLPTELVWRISNRPGDETEPAWSADGKDLVYVHHDGSHWSIVLRRHGEPDTVIVESSENLSAPSWRPDGSLISFLRHEPQGVRIDIAILSDPPLIRPWIEDNDIFDAAAAWPNRGRLLYAANGGIMTRDFNSWTSRKIPFRAAVQQPSTARSLESRERKLTNEKMPDGELVIRTERLFDGRGDAYRYGLDIVIADGLIAELRPRGDAGGRIVIDLDDLTAMPGLIDSYAFLPDDADTRIGPIILSYAVTTMLAEHSRHEDLNTTWSGQDLPGPRLLPVGRASSNPGNDLWLIVLDGEFREGTEWRDKVARWQSRGLPVLAENWRSGLGSGASLLLGSASLPASPQGRRYADLHLANGSGPIRIVSALADRNTPGVAALLASRQAAVVNNPYSPRRHTTFTPRLSGAVTVVAGSKPNGLPPGMALQAELRALVGAGLTPAEAIRSATHNAATMLGLGDTLGVIAKGAMADLIIVDGDPLNAVSDAANVVAVVRNGRFFSAIGLIEKAETKESVE